MKWTLGLLFVASVATALPAKSDEKGKAFSLFSVVTFPNDECTTAMAPPLPGMCVTADECTNSGGQASGNCASGFGVCCFRIITAAGTVTNDVTHITSAGFPAAVGNVAPVTAANLMFPIQGGANICQIRLDFETAVFAQPANVIVGACGGALGDAITVLGPSTTLNGFSSLCGTLTGQHIYIENDGANPAATLQISTGTGVFGRSWRILVRMLECDCPFDSVPPLAEPGCLQYHTGQSGQITSFNGALANNAQVMLRDLEYQICVRQQPGFCSLTLREARNGAGAMPDSFNLAHITAAGVAGTAIATSQQGNVAAATIGCIIAGMAGEGIILRNVANAAATNDVYCGGILAAAAAETVATPVVGGRNVFQVGVFSDNPTASLAMSGFDLIYNQVAC